MCSNSEVIMDKTILYEYSIKAGEFKKNIYEDPIETNGRSVIYHIRTGKNKYRLRVSASNLDKVYGSRIFSLKDDEETFRKMLISYYEERVEKKREQLKAEEEILNNLKGTKEKSEP